MENLKKKYKTPKLNIEVIGLTDVMAASADGGNLVVDYFDNSVYLSDEAGLFSYYKD